MKALNFISKLFTSKSTIVVDKYITPTEVKESVVTGKQPKQVKLRPAEMLLKQAVKLKSQNVEEAIKLIKEAIELEPNEITHSLMLCTYLHNSGNKFDAYKLCETLIAGLDSNDIGRYNAKKTLVIQKICTLYYKDQNYEDYLTNYCLWLHNTIISFACQGKTKELKKILNDNNKLKYLSPSKVGGCFVKLKIENEKELFNGKLSTHIEDIKEDLLLIAEKSSKIGKSVKTGQEKYLKLIEDEEFMKIFSKVAI